MKLIHKNNSILFLGLMVFLVGCATDNPLEEHLITEIYPAFNVCNLPLYIYYTADKFESEKLPEIRQCVAREDGNFQIIPEGSSGNDKYMIVNRSGRIIEAKGFTLSMPDKMQN